MTTLTFEEFVEKYKPIKNTLVEGASFDGCLFETYGTELHEVRTYDKSNIWTMVDGGNETMWINPGYGIVNRSGYFVTEVPWNDTDQVEVDLNDYITREEAQEVCFRFWKDNGYEFEMQDIEDYFRLDKYSIGEAKYTALEFFEWVTKEEAPADVLDTLHETFLDYV